MYNLTKFGFSTRHGLHQAAQKSSNVTECFDTSSLKVTLEPVKLGPVKSGANSPTSIGSEYWTRRSAMFLPTSLTLILFERLS